MTQRLSVASVTVAMNAAHALPRQLEALLRQTHPLKEIIVVDNASTDDTVRLLTHHYPQVTLMRLSENLGVGGGFAGGLDYAAIQRRHDWVWLLDDDTLPPDDALEKLIAGLGSAMSLDEHKDIGVLAPLLIHSATHLSYPGLLWRHGWVKPEAAWDQAVYFVDAVISSGTLIRRTAVERVGLPRADFFMDFVDFEYCLRIRQHQFAVAMIPDCRLEHAIGEPRIIKFFGCSRAWANHAPWREYYMSRNQVFSIWSMFPDWRSKLFVLRKLLRHAAGILALGEKKRACLKMMLLGFNDGRAGRLGIRFRGDCRPVTGNLRTVWYHGPDRSSTPIQ